ncbi:hypothetical protein TRAPUB_12862 [Trametes pubescens]|uniref:Uncharacterized protein n=1 Tax=Trametes pubescens TaxID=154538 RepID=A0A1M2VSN3_TRAPU|nr:hypothetical protein TRAPUB_12862 [Trametes pubescens]
MLSSFDSLSSISGSTQTQRQRSAYVPTGSDKGNGQALTRTFTQQLVEAHTGFCALDRVVPTRTVGPTMSQIIKELDVIPASEFSDEDEDGDDGQSSEEERPVPVPVTRNIHANAATNPPALARPPTGNLSQYNRYSQYHTSMWASFSNPLDNIPVPSPLETAPLPELSSMALLNPEYPTYQEQHTFMDMYEEEDDGEIEPLPLSSLIHVREDTPTPSRPPTHKALRRASTNPAVQANVARVAPRTPARGASTSHLAARSSPSGAVRRSLRLKAKDNDSPQKNDVKGSGGYSPYSSPRRSSRK